MFNRGGYEAVWATLFLLQHLYQGRLVQQEPFLTTLDVYTFNIIQGGLLAMPAFAASAGASTTRT